MQWRSQGSFLGGAQKELHAQSARKNFCSLIIHHYRLIDDRRRLYNYSKPQRGREDGGERDVDSSSHAAESALGSEVATGSSQQLIPAIHTDWARGELLLYA